MRDGTTTASGTIAAVTPGDPPYRSQKLRPPAAPPEPWLANIARSVLILFLTMCCAPGFFATLDRLTPVYWVAAFAALILGILALVKAARLRRYTLAVRGVVGLLVGAIALSHLFGGRCAEAREKHIISAVHAWFAAHGRYPESLDELPASLRPAACALQWVPNPGSGRIDYWTRPRHSGEDAMLNRTLYVYSRRIYHFRTRRFTYLD